MISEDTLDLAKSPSLGLWLNKQNEKKKKKKKVDESVSRLGSSTFAAAGRMPEPARQKQLAAAIAQLDELAENFQRLLWHQNPEIGESVLAKFSEIKQLLEQAHHQNNFRTANAANIHQEPLHGYRDF